MDMKNRILLIIGFLFFGFFDLEAQCAMCRATLENNLANGDLVVGSTINIGILYLFTAPYVFAGLIAFLWYRASKKSNPTYR